MSQATPERCRATYWYDQHRVIVEVDNNGEFEVRKADVLEVLLDWSLRCPASRYRLSG